MHLPPTFPHPHLFCYLYYFLHRFLLISLPIFYFPSLSLCHSPFPCLAFALFVVSWRYIQTLKNKNRDAPGALAQTLMCYSVWWDWWMWSQVTIRQLSRNAGGTEKNVCHQKGFSTLCGSDGPVVSMCACVWVCACMGDWRKNVQSCLDVFVYNCAAMCPTAPVAWFLTPVTVLCVLAHSWLD